MPDDPDVDALLNYAMAHLAAPSERYPSLTGDAADADGSLVAIVATRR